MFRLVPSCVCVQVRVAAAREHPFFVYGGSWASLDPGGSLARWVGVFITTICISYLIHIVFIHHNIYLLMPDIGRYGLVCRQLARGDVCISLTQSPDT